MILSMGNAFKKRSKIRNNLKIALLKTKNQNSFLTPFLKKAYFCAFKKKYNRKTNISMTTTLTKTNIFMAKMSKPRR